MLAGAPESIAFTRSLLTDLFAHMEWADAAVWKAVLACDEARSDALLRRYLLHLHTVQRAFLDAWTHQPFGFPGDFDTTTLENEYPSVKRYYGGARELLAATDDAGFNRNAVMPWAGFIEKQMGRTLHATTLGETMYQVVAHSTYHRGQVNARLRAVGGDPPLVDYIAWVWFGRPAAEWV